MIAVNTALSEEIDDRQWGDDGRPPRSAPDVETLLAIGWELREIEDLLDRQENIARRRRPRIPNS